MIRNWFFFTQLNPSGFWGTVNPVLKNFSSSPTHPGRSKRGSSVPEVPVCLYLLVPKLKVIRLTTRVVCKANTQLGSTLTSLRFTLPYEDGLYPNLAASSFSFPMYSLLSTWKMQPGMLGTREPVTPCLVPQNPGGSSMEVPLVVPGNRRVLSVYIL